MDLEQQLQYVLSFKQESAKILPINSDNKPVEGKMLMVMDQITVYNLKMLSFQQFRDSCGITEFPEVEICEERQMPWDGSVEKLARMASDYSDDFKVYLAVPGDQPALGLLEPARQLFTEYYKEIYDL